MEYEISTIRNYSEVEDIAILELSEASGLEPLIMGDSTLVNKGDEVTAIGSPIGFQNTVSTGVLSSRVNNNGYTDLQITAPISHGPSGGALFNNKGEVIGVTYSGLDSSVAQNLNFAIPIESVQSVYNEEPINMDIKDNLPVERYPEMFLASAFESIIPNNKAGVIGIYKAYLTEKDRKNESDNILRFTSQMKR